MADSGRGSGDPPPSPPPHGEQPTSVQLMTQMMGMLQQQLAAQQEAHQAVVGALVAQLAHQQAPPAPPVVQSSVPPTQKAVFRRSGRSTFRRIRRVAQDKSQYCHYCKRVGHRRVNCWRLLGCCLRCGSPKHKVISCPRPPREVLSPTPLNSTDPGSSSTGEGPPVPSQQEMFQASRHSERRSVTDETDGQ